MGHTIIKLKVEKELIEQAEKIYQDLGMDLSTAITLFLKQSVNDRSMPFKPNLNNLENIQARFEAEHGQTEKFNSVDELWTDLNED